MIKLGSITPLLFSGDGNYCLKFHFNGISSATLINMKTGENQKITLTSSIWACDISENGDIVASIDEKCNYWVTDVKNNRTQKIMNLDTQLGISSNKIDYINVFLVSDETKILSFVHYSQYKPKEECQYIIITDIESGESNILFNISNCWCSHVQKNCNDEFILFLYFRNQKTEKILFSKNTLVIAKYKNLVESSEFEYEYSKDFGISNWEFKHENFSLNSKFLPVIRLKGNLPSVYGEWCFLDYENKKSIINKNAFYYKKSLNGISWLPIENWFLIWSKKEECYYICDVLTGEKIAKITFDDFDVNVTRYYRDGREITKTIASKKDFDFTNKSTPIDAIYTAGKNKEFLIYTNHKKEYAQDINVLLSFLKVEDKTGDG